MVAVKICGLSTEATVEAACQYGAAMIGFVFFAKSPRWVTPGRAADLARLVPRGIERCGLVVDTDDATIDRIVNTVPLDLLQLHGAETPERCAQIRQRTGKKIMKAIGVAGPDDLAGAVRWFGAVDLLLFDTKPTPQSSLPGGNGIRFDWSLLADRQWPVPWLLAGGLTPDNVRAAAAETRASSVDVSSGVETAPGMKDPALIKRFLAEANR
jgi:phosphoribosylanthranilate isomerase